MPSGADASALELVEEERPEQRAGQQSHQAGGQPDDGGLPEQQPPDLAGLGADRAGAAPARPRCSTDSPSVAATTKTASSTANSAEGSTERDELLVALRGREGSTRLALWPVYADLPAERPLDPLCHLLGVRAILDVHPERVDPRRVGGQAPATASVTKTAPCQPRPCGGWARPTTV